MKRSIIFGLAAVCLLAGYLAFAEEIKEETSICPIHKMMGKPSMVSSNDGGVIVMVGNKLYKYDKNLNLVKEAEVKIDSDAMGAMKDLFCPMKKKMDNNSTAPENPTENP